MPGNPNIMTPIVNETCGYTLTTVVATDRVHRGCIVTEIEPPLAEDSVAAANLTRVGALLGKSEEETGISQIIFTERAAAACVRSVGRMGQAALTYELSEYISSAIEDNEIAATVSV